MINLRRLSQVVRHPQPANSIYASSNMMTYWWSDCSDLILMWLECYCTLLITLRDIWVHSAPYHMTPCQPRLLLSHSKRVCKYHSQSSVASHSGCIAMWLRNQMSAGNTFWVVTWGAPTNPDAGSEQQQHHLVETPSAPMIEANNQDNKQSVIPAET